MTTMSKEARTLAQRLAAYNDPLTDISDDELDNFSQDFRVRARGFKGDRLKELLESKGITIAQLAQFSGVARTAIEQMEAGERLPGAQAAQALAEALGVKKSYLYDAKETQMLKQAADVNKQADELIDRLTEYKKSRHMQYKQVQAALERAGAKVSLPTMTHWIVYRNRPSERFIEPVNKALDVLEKEPVEQEPGTVELALTVMYISGGTKFILTPDRKVLYTDKGLPVSEPEYVAEHFTQTETELFGDEHKTLWNKAFIAAEIPVIVQVPKQDKWVTE